MPYRLPNGAAFEQVSVVVFRSGRRTNAPPALARLADYFIEVGNLAQARSLMDELRRFPADLGAQAGHANLAREQVRRCVAEVSEARLRSLTTASLLCFTSSANSRNGNRRPEAPTARARPASARSPAAALTTVSLRFHAEQKSPTVRGCRARSKDRVRGDQNEIVFVSVIVRGSGIRYPAGEPSGCTVTFWRSFVAKIFLMLSWTRQWIRSVSLRW